MSGIPSQSCLGYTSHPSGIPLLTTPLRYPHSPSLRDTLTHHPSGIPSLTILMRYPHLPSLHDTLIHHSLPSQPCPRYRYNYLSVILTTITELSLQLSPRYTHHLYGIPSFTIPLRYPHSSFVQVTLTTISRISS